ncbi:MAG: hypothetical protein JWO87_3901 [Phycisphaerales bacterium]|jgi:hypothetical protein|nr:hypothetical protein [Phycisphaerales bacterium]MDB5302238.1 hypothetical protein [Phycisphaerales bacterium]MDB5302531.1 hypothetical protein [Phycisphaerales bacterium]
MLLLFLPAGVTAILAVLIFRKRPRPPHREGFPVLPPRKQK